mgnify:CR=1 FL=1
MDKHPAPRHPSRYPRSTAQDPPWSAEELRRLWWGVFKIPIEDGCWVWLDNYNPAGYGGMRRSKSTGGEYVFAHRAMYELLIGPIPPGLVIDHLCRNRGCVNPAHLEPVTMRENVLRGVGVAAENAAKTHCDHGHEFSLLGEVVVDAWFFDAYQLGHVVV